MLIIFLLNCTGMVLPDTADTNYNIHLNKGYYEYYDNTGCLLHWYEQWQPSDLSCDGCLWVATIHGSLVENESVLDNCFDYVLDYTINLAYIEDYNGYHLDNRKALYNPVTDTLELFPGIASWDSETGFYHWKDINYNREQKPYTIDQKWLQEAYYLP